MVYYIYRYIDKESINRNNNYPLTTNKTGCGYLNLTNANLCDDGAYTLKEGLSKYLSNLRIIVLRDNGITARGMEFIKEGVLEGCKSITTLDLGSSGLSSNNIGSRGCEFIKEMFSGGCLYIEYLDLSGNCIGDEGIGILSEGIENGGARINYLNLSSNCITTKGMKDLNHALKRGCIQVRTLILDSKIYII